MKTKQCGIYWIKNIINNKKIIGQSKDIERRWFDHKKLLRHNKHFNSYLQSSWNKYSEQNFNFEIIFLCPIENLDNEEIRFIKEYQTNNKEYGYNLNNGGNRPVMSEETRKKISESKTGKARPDMRKECLSEERLKQMRKLWAGGNNPQFGKVSEETKQKIRETNMNRELTYKELQHLEKLHKSHIGRKNSEETIRRMSDARKLYLAKKKEADNRTLLPIVTV